MLVGPSKTLDCQIINGDDQINSWTMLIGSILLSVKYVETT